MRCANMAFFNGSECHRWSSSRAQRRNDPHHDSLRATMKFQRRQFLHLAAGAATLPAVSGIARAQSYPSRPVTMIVPFPAGGGADVIARVMAERMRDPLGQPIIIENIGGADGSIGIGRTA